MAPGRLHKDTYLIRSGQGAARGFGREGLVGTGPRRPGAGLSRVELLRPARGGPVHPTLEPKAPGAGSDGGVHRVTKGRVGTPGCGRR